MLAESKSKKNRGTLNSVRREIRTLREKKREYLKEKFNGLETNRTKISQSYIGK
jgi:hypothetical protein